MIQPENAKWAHFLSDMLTPLKYILQDCGSFYRFITYFCYEHRFGTVLEVSLREMLITSVKII